MHNNTWAFLQRFAEDAAQEAPGDGAAPAAGAQGDKPSFEQLLKENPEYKAAYDARVKKAIEGRFRNQRQPHDRDARAILQQAKALEGAIPGFSLERELRSPAFGRLIAMGTPVEAAYLLAHQDEMLLRAMAFAIHHTRAKTAESLRIRSMRPREGGGHVARPVSPDPRSMTARQRQSMRRAVEKGERIYW